MRNKPTIAAVRGACLAALTLFSAPLPGATPPGTPIVNVATAVYRDGSGPVATTVTRQSNQAITVVAGVTGLAVSKSVDPAATVAPGAALAFRLVVENPTGVDLTGVAVNDPLDPLLGAPTAITTGAVPDLAHPGSQIAVIGSYDAIARAITWIVASLPSGARFELSFSATVDPLAAEDSQIRNVTGQTSVQDPSGTASNKVLVGVVTPALSIEKLASRSRAEVGDPIGYTLRIANVSPSLALAGAQVRDRLPAGLAYQKGSSRLDGVTFPDPAPTAGSASELVFSLGDLGVGKSRRLTYVAVPTPEAEGRDAVNEASAEATTPAGMSVSAGPARASVRVAGSLLSGEAVVVGRVFVDDNRNGVLDDGEVGVPSARVYLEDGSFTVTDVLGKYHLEGVRPGLHVLKLDSASVPDGLGSLATWSRSAGGAGTQFVDVGSDQLFKTNVGTGGWGISVSRLAAVAAYRQRSGEETVVRFPPVLASALFENDSDSLTRAAAGVVEGYAALIRERGGSPRSLEVEPSFYPLADAVLMQSRAERLRAEIARRVLASIPLETAPALAASPGGPPPEGESAARAAALPAPDDLRSVAPARGAPAGLAELEDRVREMTSEPAILTPSEGETLSREKATVEVKLSAALAPRLSVNGQTIGESQIAVRMVANLTGVAFYRYLGVPLAAGRNSIVLEGIDQWGNARAWAERIVDRLGPPHRVVVRADDATLKADGRTPVELIVEVQDSLGHPVADGTWVTLESDAGQFIGQDVAPAREGFQAATRAGRATARMQPLLQVERRAVTATAGEASTETVVSIAPDLRDWIVAGVGEATLGQGGLGSGTDLSDILANGAAADGRLALFARGRLFGASLMTLSYDSDRQRDRDQVFRALAPDRYFPIYGDSSAQGYEVEGQGKLSLRLDQPRSSLIVGDFTTGLAGGELLRYDRALTGGVGRLDMKRMSLQSFGATTPQAQIRDELDGAGVSGPYRLTRRPLVTNSERVAVETRDRFHPERTLRSQPMGRYSDYDIDYEGGTVFFKKPVPFQDDDFNPIVVVVLYETVDADGEDTVAGGRLGLRLGEAGELGTTYVTEQREGGAYSLRGADLRIRRSFGRSTLDLFGEAAASESALAEPAGAYSFRAAGTIGASVELAGYYRNVSNGFENPSRSGLPDAGTIRWGFEGAARLTGGSRLKGEVFSLDDPNRHQERRVAALDWERTASRLTGRAGVKDVRAMAPASGQIESSRLVSAGASVRISRRLEGLLSRQQVVYGPALPDYPTRSSLGLSLQVTEDVRTFLREEYDQSDAGDASRTVIGMESRLSRHTVMESRYSLEDALNGERGMAQMGIRTRLPLTQDWLGDAAVERVAATRGSSLGDFTSLGLGFEYLPAKVKFTTRYELRLGEVEDRHVLTGAGATRLSDSLSVFARQRLFFVNPEGDGSRFDGDGLLGFAFRPVENDSLNFLLKLQAIRGQGALSTGSPQARSYLSVLETNYEPVARLHLLTRLAARRSVDQLEGETFASDTGLAEVRGLYDVTSRLNVGLTGRLMQQRAPSSRTTGIGFEAGHLVVKDLWLVVGYNLSGFESAGFGDADRRAAGPFLSVRFKFDEESLIGLSRQLQGESSGAPEVVASAQ